MRQIEILPSKLAPEKKFEMVAGPGFEPTNRPVSELRRTIEGNIADLRRVGESGGGLSFLATIVPTLPERGGEKPACQAVRSSVRQSQL